MGSTLTPLRYPGGKSRLSGFIKTVIEDNSMEGCDYVEPYAGGAGVAISLIVSGHANKVHINDLNPAVYSFWYSVLNQPYELCDLIRSTPVSMDTWEKQKAIMRAGNLSNTLELGFAAFFLNRTNRSGILTGGVIGGKDQSGKWKMDARYNIDSLCLKIETISSYAEQIKLYNLDSEVLLDVLEPKLPKKSLFYLDPPYFVKSKRLYQDLYSPKDHARLAKRLSKLRHPWIVSYDDVPEIRANFDGFQVLEYDLAYSAGKRGEGAEVIYFSPNLISSELPSGTGRSRKALLTPHKTNSSQRRSGG